jgi:membrane associated rhomboid family serine protease
MGSSRYIAFYLACGVAAALARAVFNPTSTMPAFCASGAIAGVTGLATCAFLPGRGTSSSSRPVPVAAL